jgi:hypothetical protein
MASVYRIVAIRVNETSWAHIWRLHFRYLGMGYDTKYPMEAEDWLNGVEKKLAIGQCTDHEKVLFATHQLFGTASNWYETYCNNHADVDSITWNAFKAHFRNHYVPRDTMMLKKKEFTNLRQGRMTVNEYLNSFIQMSRYATEDINTDE